jgi:hypothetical protein
MAPEPTPEAWAQIRHAYENTDKPIVEICFEHEITAPMLRYRVKCWDWRRRKPFVPRHGPPPVEVASPPEEALFSPLPLPSPGGGGSANAEGMSRGGVSFVSETFTPPRSQDARDPPPPGEREGSQQARPACEGEGKIVPRLQAAVARILPAIEATIARLASGELNSRDLEKTGRTLATLTRTLRELNALLVQQDAPLQPDDDPVPKDMDEFRYELARRIRGFIEARKSEDGAQPGQAAGPQGAGECPPAAAVDGPARA